VTDYSAEYFEAHMDDPDEWGDPVPAPSHRKSEVRQRSTVVSVRLNTDELATLQRKADDAGLTISGFLRHAAVDDPEQEQRAEQDLVIIIHRETGKWWAEIIGESGYAAADPTFDGLCERLVEGLHLLGLSRERTTITITTEAPRVVTVTTAGPRTVTLWGSAS
jgi:Mobilization protein NikA